MPNGVLSSSQRSGDISRERQACVGNRGQRHPSFVTDGKSALKNTTQGLAACASEVVFHTDNEHILVVNGDDDASSCSPDVVLVRSDGWGGDEQD